MKRFLCVLLVALALVGLMTTVASAEEYAMVTSENGYGVRMREGPSKAYRVVTTYDVGTTVIVQQRGTGWSQIRVGETVGWMMNEFLIFGTSGTGTGSGGASGGVGTGTVVSDNGLRVWLRTTPGGKRIQLYSPGTAVTILTYGDEWHYISIGGVRGYMMSRYISVTPPPAPSSKAVEAVSVNYPSPVVDDVLQAAVTPSDATVTYSWKVGGVEQSNSATLRVLNDYIGKPITLTVTGTGVYYGSKTYTTDPVVSSRQVTQVSLNKPQPFVGDTLSAVLKPSSATVSYSWRVGGVEVSTEATYTVQQSDIGKLIQLKVNGIDTFSGVAICSASGEVRSATEVFSVDLSIKNRPVMVGEVLSSVVTPSGASVNCVWMADGDVVATTASYMVTANDLGKKISLRVEGIAPYTGSATTSAYGLVQSANITAVALNNYTLTAGNGCYAVLTPGNATATYEWYKVDANGVESPLGLQGSYITVPPEAIGHRIKVRVRGAGIYGVSTFNAESGVDYIDSPLSNPIISNKVVTAVALNNTSPVIGETITVDLTPDALDPLRASGDISYIWTVGTETYTNTSGQYAVKATDVGKTISVKAITAYPNAGEAISAATNPVRASGEVTGVGIINQRTNANASQTAPEVGDTLVASLNPWTAASVPGWISYSWWVDGAQVGTASTLTIDPAWNGKQITLIADVAAGCPYYNYSKQATEYPNRHSAVTASVAQYAAVNASIYITLPKAGETPQVSVSGSGVVNNQTVEVCNGSITWLENGALAVLDSKGHFKPQTTYTARLTLNANHGLSWNNAVVNVNGAAAKQLSKAGNVFEFTFSTTEELAITQFYISGVPRPVPGAVPSVISYSTDQYTAEIKWDGCLENGTFKEAASYTVPITIKPNAGYTVNGIADNVFKVSTADATTSTKDPATGNIIVTAYFNVDHTVTVTAERTTINIDGVNVAVVQCFANVSNAVTQPTFTWSVQYKQSNSTWINEKTGVLNVGPDEILDKDIVVWASCTIDGKTYSGSLALHLVSGTQEDTSIKAVFNGNQPTSVLAGSTAQYSAYATNSVIGVEWAIEGNTSPNTKIEKLTDSTAQLTVAKDETAPSINVIVWPKQAPGERVKTNVQIIRTYTVTYTDGQGGKVFTDVVYRNLQKDTATPKYTPNVILEGWKLIGWSPSVEPTVTDNVTYVAQWQTSTDTSNLLMTMDLLPADATFTVTYTDGVEDAVIFNDQATSGLLAGDATPAAPQPTREGYRFDGWEPAVTETVSADATYTAKWTKLYTIVFLDGTEENNVVLSQQVAEGENTPLPANPTREGYDFDAWIDQNNNGWGDSASKPVTGDATYTATWRAHDAADGTTDTLENGEDTAPGVRVVVTNGVDGGVIGESTSQTIMDAYAYVQSLAAPTHPTDPTMVFAGWSDFQYDEVGGVVTFEATWKAAETEQPADTTEEQPADTTDEQPADITEEQPADTTDEQPADTTEEQPADTTDEQPADTTGEQPADTTGEQPADTTDEQPADTTDEQPADTTDGQPADITEEQPEGPVLYTITYIDGQGNELSSYQLEEGSPMPACAAPERDLFVFTGWNPGVAETVTADVTYEAQWADDWNANGIPDSEDARHTITYKDEDGTVYKTETAVLTGMGTPACAAPEKEGMVFEGWSPAVADIATADATYVAQWSEAKEEPEAKESEAEDRDVSEGEEGEEIEEPDDETLEKEYEALAESSNIHISFEKGASKIGRGKSSTYAVKVSGVPEGVPASVSWRLSGGDLVATSGKASGDGFKVTVGEGETAETLRVVVTVKVGDITISRGKRVSIVDPTVQTEEEKEETTEPAEEPEDEEEKAPADSEEESPEDTKEEPAGSSEMTEEEMAEQAMKEGNSDPAALSF